MPPQPGGARDAARALGADDEDTSLGLWTTRGLAARSGPMLRSASSRTGAPLGDDYVARCRQGQELGPRRSQRDGRTPPHYRPARRPGRGRRHPPPG